MGNRLIIFNVFHRTSLKTTLSVESFLFNHHHRNNNNNNNRLRTFTHYSYQEDVSRFHNYLQPCIPICMFYMCLFHIVPCMIYMCLFHIVPCMIYMCNEVQAVCMLAKKHPHLLQILHGEILTVIKLILFEVWTTTRHTNYIYNLTCTFYAACSLTWF